MAAAETEVGLVVSVEGVLRKATTLISDQEFGNLATLLGIQDDILSLKTNLQVIQAAFSVPDTMIDDSEYFKWLMNAVNSVTATAEDLLDLFAYEALWRRVKLEDKKKRNKVINFFTFSSNSLAVKRMKRMKMIHRLKQVNSRLSALSFEFEYFVLDVQMPDGERLEVQRISRPTDSSRLELELLKTATDTLKLKKFLLSPEHNAKDLFFISVVGMGGLGKTTFTRAVFNDAEVENHFDERMWVCVSKEFKIYEIMKDMFRSLTHTVLDNTFPPIAIVWKLMERLKGKKYLLVLDDVWNEDMHLWTSLIMRLLKLGGSRGCKIMVTTRSESISSLLQPGLIYKLSVQPMYYSWELFKQIAFAPGGPEMTTTLSNLGKKIVEACGGHPLAIKLVAGLLNSKRSESDWEKIAGSTQQWDSSSCVKGVLKLCYDHLSSHSLKQCFLYCSIFQKGSVMEKDELIQLWMAQGFLNPPQGSGLSMEDLGSQYLDFLVRASLLENAEQDEPDRRKSYKMHDLLHDLGLSLTKGYCLTTKEEVNSTGHGFKALHMSLINYRPEILKYSRQIFKRLRTLRWVDCGVPGDHMLARLTSVRVLTVIDSRVVELPASISKLKLLHYLDISKTKIRKLPDSISKLYNLQTLRVYDLLEMPKDCENLVNLRNLYIESLKDLDKLNSLPSRFQEIIDPSLIKASFKAYLHKNCPIDKLHVLLKYPDSYSSLGIYRLENVSDYEEAKEAKLSSMSTLDRLQLHWTARRVNCYDEEVLKGLQPHPNIKHLIIENYKGSTFPSWMATTRQSLELHHLVKMELLGCSCCERVPPLGHLPFLKIVKIYGMAKVKTIGADFYGLKNLDDQSSSGWGVPTLFPALRELTLKEMACLEEWSEPAHLSSDPLRLWPLLEKLEVEQCPKLIRLPNIIRSGHKCLWRLQIALCDILACLPEGVGSLESLEDLELRGLPSLTQLSVRWCDNLKSLTLGDFSSASEIDCHTQHASGSKTSLRLKGGDRKLTSLPEQLQHLSALRYLTISGHGGLESFPEWFCELKSLQILKLEFCWKLRYFPDVEKMQKLTNLDELDICYCPLLEEGCTKGSRPEWDKISHIPRIKINYEEIKFRRRNQTKTMVNATSSLD